MFDQSNRQRKQKNWRILNLNFNDIQQQPHYNRSIIADPSKKYCPRKDTSQQKIFSKSKERINFSKVENSDNQSINFKGLIKESIGKRCATEQSEILNQTNDYQVGTETKINLKSLKITPNQRKIQQKASLEIHEENQTGPRLNSHRRTTTMPLSNFHFEEILNSSKPKGKPVRTFTELQNQINENSSILAYLKEQFQVLKSTIQRQLDEQREFLRQTIVRITEEFHNMREKIREEVYAEFEIKHKSSSNSYKQSMRNSTEIKLEEILKSRDSSFNQIEVVQIPHITNLDTFGRIQQSNFPQHQEQLKNENYRFNSKQVEIQKNMDNNHQNYQFQGNFNGIVCQFIEPIQKNHKFGTETEINEAAINKQIQSQQLRIYKSSENFAKLPQTNPKPSNQPPINSETNLNNSCSAQIQPGITNRKHIPDIDHMKRYSEILKKKYEQNVKKSPHLNKVDKQKISDRISHLQKFQGAMQKLKTEILEFKNLSDTKDLKKIKFSSDQKPLLNYLKEIGPSQLNVQQMMGETGETKVV